MLDPLHDPIRLAKQISTIAYRLVRQSSGEGGSLEQQILRAPSDLKSLAKSSDLLSDSFDLLSIYFNPEAATYGAKHPVNVHGLLTKLIAIFRIDSGDESANRRIFINGECYRNAFVYDSFKLVPFALLTNAVKYGVRGSIEISVYDRGNGVEISVISTGPLIEVGEMDIIFEKRRRGKWAAQMSSDGRGVGLFLAAIIAKAHGFKINVSSNPTGAASKGAPLAVNKFWFMLPYQNN
ncbi:ATP-binding protein [Burkholderia anthina]|nr:ATP-binding protein [Burkholderia anthina]